VADAAISVWGAGRVGVHLAPRGDAHSMGYSNLSGTFEYVARELGARNVAFICAREYLGPDRIGSKLRAAFGGVYVVNEKFNFETASQAIESGEADAVAFGKLFIANPDLPQRFALRAPLNEPRVPDFYAGGAQGYTDYPSMAHAGHSADSIRGQARVKAQA
jgi:2,4-dienoyl-CoA reductase-like NADH-dependent reductase (Old Yellow Enzyme family)